MGAEVLAGPYYQPLGIFSGQGPTEEEQERAAEVHRRVADTAQGKGVLLVLEALNRFECYFLNTMRDAAAYVKRVGHPNLRLTFDTFHANIEEKDPVGCITRHLDLIRHVHVSENDRETPGRGHVPWLATFRALRQGGYDGWLTVEAFGRTLPELAATTCVWRDLSSGPEQVYTEAFRLIQTAPAGNRAYETGADASSESPTGDEPLLQQTRAKSPTFLAASGCPYPQGMTVTTAKGRRRSGKSWPVCSCIGSRWRVVEWYIPMKMV